MAWHGYDIGESVIYEDISPCPYRIRFFGVVEKVQMHKILCKE